MNNATPKKELNVGWVSHVLCGVTRQSFFLTLFFLLTLSACAPKKEPLHQEQVLAFGTLVDITIWGADDNTAQQASAEVIQLLNRLHRTWHAWEPSELTRINEQIAAGKPAGIDPEMLTVIQRAQERSRASMGLFNPAIGRLIGLWGFHSEERMINQINRPPEQQRIEALVKQHPGMDDLRFEQNTLRSINPAVQLDFGAYIKGYGVDLAIEKLRARGIRNAIVNAGGDLRAIGRHGDRPWHIGIRHPRSPGIIAAVEIQGDESVFTSGDYERYFEYQGKRYHHIMDPRTGYPAAGAVSATVISNNAADALGASTALIVAGPRDWQAVVKSMGIKLAMLIDTQGRVYLTPAMNQRLHFESNPAPQIILSDSP